jgi:hypothetical protein
MFDELTEELLDLTVTVKGEQAGRFAFLVTCCSCCCCCKGSEPED